MTDFGIDKIVFYSGPNYYLDRKACVFNLYLDSEGHSVSYYEPHVLREFPGLEARMPDRVGELFARLLVQVLKMGIDLCIETCDVYKEDDAHVIAVEYFDEIATEEAVYLVRDWFRALNAWEDFDFRSEFIRLQEIFDRSVYGGPTVYSLIEAGMKRGIPVHYLYEENQFQWGYGKKQIRGRSTTLHMDGIKDTEFTMYKDMVKDHLLMCGFPTPEGKNCMTAEEAAEEAEALGFPVVVKPLAGHKGQGVTTGISSSEEVQDAFDRIVNAAREEDAAFEGAIVERQVEGTDHRLLTVGGKFAAGLQRIPAYVDGNGRDTVARLIEKENATAARQDTVRSPLSRIRIDDDLKDYLALRKRSLDDVPEPDERVFLRRVANVSAGGVSVNVTDRVHPKNIRLAENIAKFFHVTCLGIDVLAGDISLPWDEGNFGIIEINAGPGVFMHLAPAVGEPVDVPGSIMNHLFGDPPKARIPIIAGNRLTLDFCRRFYNRLSQIRPGMEFGCLVPEGVFFNGEFFCKNKKHDQNVKIILRNPKLDFAVFCHGKDGIFDDGIFHMGADAAVLEEPHYGEKILKRDILPDGFLVTVREGRISVFRGDRLVNALDAGLPDETTDALVEALIPVAVECMKKYE